jgi:FkbM family methyltransferase
VNNVDKPLNRQLRKFVRKIYSVPRFIGRYYLVNFLKHFFSLPQESVWIDIDDQLKIEVNPRLDKGVESALFYTGIYEAGTLSFIKSHLKKGDVFVDVGANIGLMSMIASNAVGESGKVISIEPNPSTALIFKKNIAANSLSNVLLVNKAIGSTPGKALIYPNWHINRGGASLIRKGESEEGIEVEVKTLDSVLDEFNLTPTLIKIDVEGFELEVLKSARKLFNSNRLPTLIIELSSERETAGGEVGEIIQFIKGLSKYRFYVNKGSKESNGQLVEIMEGQSFPIHDNIYCMHLD